MPERRRRRSAPCAGDNPVPIETAVNEISAPLISEPTKDTDGKRRRSRSATSLGEQPSIADVLFSDSINDISNFEDSMIPQSTIGSVLPFAEKSLTEQEKKQQELYPDTFIPIPSSYDALQTTETLRWNEPIVPIGRSVDEVPIACFPTPTAEDEHFPPQFHFESWNGGQPISAVQEQGNITAPYEYYSEVAQSVGRTNQQPPVRNTEPAYQVPPMRAPAPPEARRQPQPSPVDSREQTMPSAYDNNATAPYAIQRACDDASRYAPHPESVQGAEPVAFEKGHWVRTIWMVISVLLAVCLIVLFYQIFMLLYQSNQQTQSLYSQEDSAYLQSSNQTDTSVELLPIGQTYAPTQEPVIEVTPSPTPIIQLSS